MSKKLGGDGDNLENSHVADTLILTLKNILLATGVVKLFIVTKHIS